MGTSTLPSDGEPRPHLPHVWKLLPANRTLAGQHHSLHLTGTELRLLTGFVECGKRVLSKSEMVALLQKDPDTYKGLEMSLSRLQTKFRLGCGGQDLLRAVRNRGYCLVQELHIQH
ncbi:hypothetical protein D3C76_976900 [compost metagenome]|uniref:Transcriptional regulatory protein, C terminal n=1 Tax=Pseudomonas jinjuensis TaxID=198616 RepID=A0A1H0IWD5_9PSED|nr:winged helix-turn-helix domain-containing protein [Pseudomonas jinjuensis]SDO35371.1 Transcriptional regulatory protein, C terminal [Pseudomonas jinjuensis]